VLSREQGRRDEHANPQRIGLTGEPEEHDRVGRERHRLAAATDEEGERDRRDRPEPEPEPDRGDEA